MATVDSLEITLETRFEKASTALNGVVKQLGLVAEGISSIGNNRGLNEFARKAAEAVKEFSAMKDVGKDISNSIQPQMQKVSKTLEQFNEKYKDLGKGFQLKGSTDYIQKQIDSLSNSLEKAKLKKDELEKSGKTEDQKYEYAVKDVIKYTNQIESLKNQLAEIQATQPKLNFSITGIEESEQKISSISEQIKSASILKTDLNYNSDAMKSVFGETAAEIQNYTEAVEQFGQQASAVLNAPVKTNLSQMSESELNEWFNNLPSIKAEAEKSIQDINNTLNQIEKPRNINISTKNLNYNADAMIAVFGEAAGSIKNYGEAVEQFGKEAGKTLNESTKLNLKINGVDETEQKLKGFSGELQRMGNLFSQTFSNLKSGEIFRYFSDSIKTYVKNAQIAASTKVYTDDFKRLVTDIDRAKSSLEKLQQKKRDLEAGGVSEEDKQWQKVTAAIATAENQLSSYKAQKREMEMSGADVQPSGGLADQSFIKNAGIVAGEALRSLRQGISEIGGSVSQAVGNIPIIGRVAKEAAFLGQKAFQGLKFAMTGIVSAGQKVANTLSTITSGMARLAAGTKNAISKFSNLAKSFIGIKSSSKKMNNAFSQGFKALLRYGLGIRSVYALLNKLRTAMKEAFQNLSRYSSETNASLSMLKSSLFALKNSLAVAFDPIVNIIAPYLSMFIDMLTKAFNIVGQFFSALTGKATAVQTKKPFMDYAAGLEKTGSAAKKAEKDIKHGLRAFDELNNLTSNEPTSGSGGGGSGATEILPEDMFTTVTIESDISDFAEKIKAAWEMQDFTEVGGIVGEKLKNALDGIDMTPVQERAEKIGASLGTFLNGVVETDGLADSIGRTIGEAINTGVTGINNFLDNTHWDSVGIFIGDGLNEIVNTVDWEDIGHLFAAKFNAIFEVLGNVATTFEWSDFGLHLATSANTFINDFDWAENGARLGTLAKGFLDTLISFLENTEWQELGNGIADFIGGIDWGGILKRIAEGVGAALGGFAALLWGLIEDAWNSVVTWWGENAFEDGKFVPEKLFAGIGEALVNIGTWIKENIAIPFLDGLSKAFGLDVSGSELFEMGTNIIFGVFDGIIDTIKGIGTWIYDHIFKPFIDGFKAAFQIHSPSKVMEEQGGFIMQGLLDGINALVQRVVDIFNNIKEKIVNVWNSIKTKTTEIWNGIKTKVSDTWSGIKTSVSDFTDSIKNVVKNAWDKVKSTTEDVWDGIKNAIKSPINGILGFVNGLIEGVEGGLNRMIRAVNSLHFDLPDWLPVVGGKTLGFTIPEISIPEIPYLAKGAVFRGGNPFLAVVNDQKRGQTNVETPLKVIQEALREELQNFSINFKAVVPDTLNYGYEPAPVPNYARAYGNYKYDASAYNSSGFNGGNSEMANVIENAVYKATYNAVSSAIGNSKMLEDIKGEIEAGHVIQLDGKAIFESNRKYSQEFMKRTRRPAFEF